MNRSDITDWIIHFVHKRNPDNDPAIWNIDPDTDERLDFPDYFDNEGNWKIIFNKDSDEEFYITPDAPAFSVLKKIIHDGYLKSGWSFRKDVPTIYGNRSAVCFTEMPLHGLIEYVKKRGKKYADTYGIAFKKNELFNAGGRPVIYGLSTQHLEEEDKKTIGLRNLSATKTGIGLIEQYRYVATSFSNNKTIDWTHEREWRWALPDDRYGVAGLPFILDPDDYANFFSDIIIIVNTKDEVDNIFLQLKNQKDSGSTNYGFGYNIDLIKKIKVISIEQLKNNNIDLKKIRIEDLPSVEFNKIHEIEVREETLDKVKKIWSKAQIILNKAEQKILDEKYKGEDIGACGFGYVSTCIQSEITQAFINLNIAKTFSDRIYTLYGLSHCWVQSIDVHEAGVKAVANFLTRELGQPFDYYTVLD